MDSFKASAGAFIDNVLSNSTKQDFPPLEVNPCANFAVRKRWACSKPGTRACGSCRLVSYCSKECQKAHWTLHKKDCKNVMGTDAWKPIWVLEQRPPQFLTDNNAADFELNEFSTGIALWGNTPATDVINLKDNENDLKKDFTLAFPASGDLRHVMKTINSLPCDYTGHLKFLLNDLTPHVVSRNTMLLLILGAISDKNIAADVALHFWYSAFMPAEYRMKISAAICKFLPSIRETGSCLQFKLGSSSTMSCYDLHSLAPFFAHMIQSSDDLQPFHDEYNRVRHAPSRRDLHDRMYSSLRPSHRIAFQEYRRFGLILPFGAPNAHFNVANESLFAFDHGRWLQTDFADPLEGWNIADVVKAGKSHGAQPEDLYGCLYFFLSQELRKFAQRLHTFKISFTMANVDASILAIDIKSAKLRPYGFSASAQFDRIHVSNILDVNYVGIEDVLKHWAPLLGRNHTAVLIGYFMNWVALQMDGRMNATYLQEGAGAKVLKRMVDDGRVSFPVDPTKTMRGLTSLEKGFMIEKFHTAVYFAMQSIEYYYENSKPFSAFLKKQGLPQILRRENLQLRDSHTIVPHRHQAPLQGKPDELPDFSDGDSWYYSTAIHSYTGTERFVEFSRC